MTPQKSLELINKFGKVAGYKISTQKSVSFLYTKNKRSEREIQENNTIFSIASKRINAQLQISLPKEAKDMYSENIYKMLIKEIEDNTKIDKKKYHMLGLGESILWK